MKRVTVFGATGMLGKPVVAQLVEAGFTVTALVRDLEKATLVLPAGVKLIAGNLNNTAAIEKALSDAEIIYISLSVDPASAENDFQSEREGMSNLLAAAKKYPIQRIAYLASIVQEYQGFKWWVFDLKRKAVESIKSTGIPYTLFYPSSFMETIPERFIQGNRINLAGTAKSKNYWIAGQDYAKQVVKSLQITNGPENKEYFIQGPEALTIEEACNQFVQYYPKRKIKIAKAPLGLLKVLGLFSNNFRYVAKIVEAILNYPETFRAESTWKELGKPGITIEHFAKNTA